MGLLGITDMVGLKSYIATAVYTTWDDTQSSKFMKFHGLQGYIKGAETRLLTGLRRSEGMWE